MGKKKIEYEILKNTLNVKNLCSLEESYNRNFNKDSYKLWESLFRKCLNEKSVAMFANGYKAESLKESLDFFDIVDNIPLNVLNDDICQGDVFTGFYFNSEESANKFANYLERKGFVTDQSEDSSYAKGFNYKVSVFDDIEGKYFDDETYEESLKEAIDDEIDLDYETDFDDGTVEEGNVFTEGGVDYAWIEREAGPIYLDFDRWAVWSAREYVNPEEFIILHDNGKGYDFDSVAFKKKAMAAPIVYFVVEEDTGFIDWGPEDSEIAAKDFLNGKKEDWENDMDESLDENKELEETYTVNLHYEDVGDGREYDYEADYDDVLEYLMDFCVDEDDAPENSQDYMEWVVDNFDSLLKKYEYEVLEHFYEDASQEEYDERHSSYEPEYDPMD